MNHRDRGQPTRPVATLPAPPRYFPVAADGYRMRPGLRPLGTDVGAGALDGTLFQFHSGFPRYRENKLRCRREDYTRYVGASRLPGPVAAHVARFLAARLATEWPELFVQEPLGDGGVRLTCTLTSEVLRFGSAMEWVGLEAGVSPDPPYRDAWDALACQIPEDLAVVCRAPDATDWLAAVHVCAPSDWAPEEKLGLEFAAVHRPVPGIAPLLRASGVLVDGMIRRPPTVRLVWGLAPDDRLNRHPHAPGVQRQIPRFAAQDTDSPPAYLRVERQGIWGFPAVDAALFTIGVTVTDLRRIREVPEQCTRLAAAIRSMDAATRAYKGVGDGDELLAWLAQNREAHGNGA